MDELQKLMDRYDRYKSVCEKQIQKICKNINMTSPLSETDHRIICLLTPFFDPAAEYEGNPSEKDLIEFSHVGDEESLYYMLTMLCHPQYEWINEEMDTSTNGTRAAWKLVRK